MPDALLTAVALPFLLFLPGVLLVGGWRQRGGLTTVEWGFLCVLISVLGTGLAALILALAGCFSLPSLLAVSGVGCGIAGGLRLRGYRFGPCRSSMMCRPGFLIPLLIGAGVLYGWPHEYIGGGWDPGVYLQTGAQIARQGTIQYEDNVFASLPPSEQALFVHVRGRVQRFPGFRLLDQETGSISPQFYHLYPCWLAIAWSLFGLDGMLYVNTFFGLLALVAVYLFAARAFDEPAAVVACLFLSVNVIQIWFVRLSTSEVLTQYLVWSGLYVFALHASEGGRSWGGLAAACFGVALLTKISSLLILPGLCAVLLYRTTQGVWRRDVPLWIVLTGFGVAALWYNQFAAPAYIDLVNLGAFLVRRPAAAMCLVVAIVLALWSVRGRGRAVIRSAVQNSWVRGGAAAALAGVATWAFVFRPSRMASSAMAERLHGELLRRFLSDASAFREMAWFVTIPGLCLAVAGCAVMIWRGRNHATALFVLVVLTPAFLFFKSKMIEPFYMMTLRRYVPVVVPALAVAMAYMVVRLGARRRREMRYSRWCVVAIVALLPLWKGRHIVRQVDLRGLVAACAEIEQWTFLPPSALVVCDGYWLAAPLHFFHGWNTLAISDPTLLKAERAEQAMRRWVATDRPVYYLTHGRRPFARGLVFAERGRGVVSSSRLEHSIQRYPVHRVPRVARVQLFQVMEDDGAAPGPTAADEIEIPVGWNWIGIGPGFSAPRRMADGSLRDAQGVHRLVRQMEGRAEMQIPWNGRRTEMTVSIEMKGRACATRRMTVYKDAEEAGRVVLRTGIHEYEMMLRGDKRSSADSRRATLRFALAEDEDASPVRVRVESVFLRPAAGLQPEDGYEP